jgi:hypothetical protein
MSKSKSRKKINDYIIHLDAPLGEGSYAKVYLAYRQHAPFAVKIVDRAMSTLLLMQSKPTSIRLRPSS